MIVGKIQVAYTEGNIKFINTLCGQNLELLILKEVEQRVIVVF
jgi:hypothetical protein